MGSFVTASPHIPLPANKTDGVRNPPTGRTDELDASDINDTQNAINDLYTHAGGWLNVVSFGADPTGVADSAPAIRDALMVLESLGGGRLVFPAGEYLLDSFGPSHGDPGEVLDFVAELTSDTHLIGMPGARLRAADGLFDSSTAAWKGNIFMAIDADNISIEGLEIDFNGPNNLASIVPWHVYGLYCVNTNSIAVRRCYWYDNPGFNYIVTYGEVGSEYTPSATGLVVEDCEFRNGGTSIPGNTLQTDFSAVYSTNFGTHISRNRIFHDVRPINYCGGIELHASDSQATENLVEDSYPAVYLGLTPSTLERLKVQNNIFKNCHSGVVIPGGFSTSGDYDHVDISGNAVTLLRFAALNTGFHSDFLIQTTPAGRANTDWTNYPYVIKNLNVSNNTVESLNGTEADQYTDGISLGSVENLNIHGNRFYKLSGSPFRLIGSPYGAKYVRFTSNVCADFGNHNHVSNPRFGVGLMLGGSSTTPSVAAYTADGIVVEDNTFALTSALSGSSVVATDWDGGTTLTNWVCHNNQALNLSTDSNGTNISDTPVTNAHAVSLNATLRGNVSGSTTYAYDLQPYQARSITVDQVTNLTKANGTTAAIDYRAGRYVITATGATVTVGAPANVADGGTVEFVIKNTSGGALTTTWDTAYKLSGAWTDPATGKRRSIKFIYDSGDSLWYEMFRSSGDA